MRSDLSVPARREGRRVADEQRVRRVSHSEFKLFRRCRRAWWLGYLRGYTLRKYEPGALDLGKLTHLGLELYSDGSPLQDALRAIAEETHRLVDESASDATRDLWYKAGSDAQNFLVGYEDWLVSTGADQRYVHVASEEELQMPLAEIGGVQWVLIGKVDRRVYDRATDQQRFIDFKTCASFDQIIKDASRNEQFPTYEMLLRHNYPDQRTGGGVWRMIKKSKRARDGDGEFFKDYDASFNEHVLETIRARYRALAMEMHAIANALSNGEDHQYVVPPTPDYSCAWQCDKALICDTFDDGSRAEQALEGLYVATDPYARYRMKWNEEQ